MQQLNSIKMATKPKWMEKALSKEEQKNLLHFQQHFNPELGVVVFPDQATSSLLTLQFCRLLCRSGSEKHLSLAQQALEGFFRPQITDPEDENYGGIPLRIGAGYRDKNAPLFHLPLLLEIRSCPALSKKACAILDEGLKRLLAGAERRWHEETFDLHRDFKGYTNVFLMYIQALLLGAGYLGLPRWQRRAECEWKRWFHHVSYYGIDECVSTVYHEVDHETLIRLSGLFSEKTFKDQVRMVIGHLEATQRILEHPRLRLPVCGSSRDYRRFLRPGTGRFKPFEGSAGEVRRSFPYEAEGRATTLPFRFKSWQDSHSGLGTMTGGYYFWQNLYGLVMAGESEQKRELAFLPGTFSTTPGFVDQKGSRALFVFGRVPSSLYRTQMPTPDDRIPEDMGFFGMGVTTGWSVVADKPGRLHLSAYGQELFLDAFAVEGGCCVPAPLRKIRRPAGEETRLASSFECDIDEYLFPDKTTWFGVVLELRKITANVPAMARVELEMKGRSRHFKCGDLGVSLFESPTGEQVQLYPEDWRTLPLFRSPDHLLWPGQWLQQSINV